jgi:hypothetical protein
MAERGQHLPHLTMTDLLSEEPPRQPPGGRPSTALPAEPGLYRKNVAGRDQPLNAATASFSES